MKPIEFYTTPEGEVTMRPLGEAERQLRESDTEFIQAFLEILREFYTEAYTALMEFTQRVLKISVTVIFWLYGDL